MSSPKRAVKLGPIGEIVRENVRLIRTAQDMTAQELSDEIGPDINPLGRAAISEIERGARRVDVDDLLALAAGLSVTPSQLLLPGWRDTVEIASHGSIAKSRYTRWVTNTAALFNTRQVDDAAALVDSWEREAKGLQDRLADAEQKSDALAAALEDVRGAEGRENDERGLTDLYRSNLEAVADLREKLRAAQNRINGAMLAIEESLHGND